MPGFSHTVTYRTINLSVGLRIPDIVEQVKSFMYSMMTILTAWALRFVSGLSILWMVPETRLVMTAVLTMWFCHLAVLVILVSTRAMDLAVRIFVALSSILFLACVWHLASAEVALAVAADLLLVRAVARAIIVW
ncbi:hypothetical protein E8E14_007640 [Neopestalotiopsis sp. 37M]|nr:hypothetical protein E8E14_007640 [Neopestalotiopsis sp. 37M]